MRNGTIHAHNVSNVVLRSVSCEFKREDNTMRDWHIGVKVRCADSVEITRRVHEAVVQRGITLIHKRALPPVGTPFVRCHTCLELNFVRSLHVRHMSARNCHSIINAVGVDAVKVGHVTCASETCIRASGHLGIRASGHLGIRASGH